MIFDQLIELINHHNFEDNVMQLILAKKMYYHNEVDIYYRTTLSLNLWRRVYCDAIDEWRFMQSL